MHQAENIYFAPHFWHCKTISTWLEILEGLEMATTQFCGVRRGPFPDFCVELGVLPVLPSRLQFSLCASRSSGFVLTWRRMGYT